MIPFRSTFTLANPAVVTATDDTDAAAYFAAMTTAPSTAERSRVNDLIRGLKTDTIYARLGRFHLLAAETAQAARLDVRTPSKTLSAVNIPTFTANRGYAGDASSAYLDLQETYTADSNFTQDSATIGTWCITQGSSVGARPHAGVASGTGRGVITARSGGNEIIQICDATNDILQFSNSRVGHRTATRTAAGVKRGYFNGARTLDATTASTSAPTATACLLRNNTIYSDDLLAVAYSAAGLSDTDVSNLHNRLNTYLSTKGAV